MVLVLLLVSHLLGASRLLIGVVLVVPPLISPLFSPLLPVPLRLVQTRLALSSVPATRASSH